MKKQGHSKRPVARAPETATLLERCLPYAILLSAVFILFTPVIVDYDFYYPHIFFKSILFRLAVQLMTLAYAILAALSPSYRPRFNRLIWALVAYFGFMLVSSLPGISIYAWGSWFGEFTRMGGMITQLHLLAYFLVLTQSLRQERHWHVLFTTLLFAGILMGLSTLIQTRDLHYVYRFSPTNRFGGASDNANWLASGMVLDFFVAAWFMCRDDRKKIFPFIAGIWFFILIFLDITLIVLEKFTGTYTFSKGLDIPEIVLFAGVLHATSLVWLFMRRIVWVGMAYLGGLGIYFLYWMYQSGTRGALLALAASLAFMAVFYVAGAMGRRMKLLIALLLVSFIILSFTIYHYRNSPWVQSHPTIVRYTGSTYSQFEPRVLAWKVSAFGILDRPLFGWGLENYKDAFNRHFPPGMLVHDAPELWFDRAHNVIMDVGTTTGLAGLGAFVLFYGWVFLFLLRLWLDSGILGDGLLLAGLIAANLIQSMFSFDTVNTEVDWYLMLAYVCYLARQRRDAGREIPSRSLYSGTARKMAWVAVSVVAILVVPAIHYGVVLPSRSNLMVNRGIALETALDSRTGERKPVFRETIMDHFQGASDCQTTGRHLVREEFADFAATLAWTPYVPPDDRVRVLNKAVEFLEESIRQEPMNVRHYIYLGGLVNGSLSVIWRFDPRLARTLAEKTLAHLQTAVPLSPTRPQLYFELNRVLLALGRPEEALAAIRRGIELSPPSMAPLVDLAATSVMTGRYDEAEAAWKRLRDRPYTPTAEEYDRLITCYHLKKQYVSMARLYRERLEADPNNATIMARLAAVYLALGDKIGARETALKAINLSPGVAAELRPLLDNLNKLK